MHRNTFIKLSTGILTLVLIIILFSQISLNELMETILTLDTQYLIFGFFFYVMSYIFRTARFHTLLNKDVTFKGLFNIVCVHNMLNNLLPARTGELSYVFLLNKTQGKKTGDGIATLVIARILDFIAIGVIFLFLFMMIRHLSGTTMQTAFYAIITIVLSLGIMVFLLKSEKAKITRFIIQIFYLFKTENSQMAKYILEKVEETFNSFDALKQLGKYAHLISFIYTFGIWGCTYLFFYCIALAMSINIGFFQILFAASFAVFTTVLPIQGLGGFGTIEGGWAIGFILVNVPESVAVASGFTFHLVMLACTIFLGIGGYVFMRKKKSNNNLVAYSNQI